MIECRRLGTRLGEFALDDVSFEVPRGAFGVVIGPAGSGKTSLLETIAGVIPATAGQVFIDTREVTTRPVHERGVALVYQHAYLFPHLTVRDNVAYGAAEQSHADEAMEAFGVSALGGRDVRGLSGGERQLVALARAIAQRPSVLLLDEPFSALDPRRRTMVRRYVRDLHRERGMTVLHVTHDFAEAGLLGDVIVLLDGGRVLQAGEAAEVFRRPATPYVAEFLGAENVLEGEARVVDGAVTGDDGVARAMEVRCGPLTIHSVSPARPGPCHAVIRAEEVVLARARPASSARNNFTGTVSEVAAYGAYVRVIVTVQGVPLVALLTIPSLHDLDLAVGAEVHVSFKAFAVHLC
ncbi:MAG: ABC transporter ATP-binding protein [Gemmatimonadaceae bacterium]|nr:ABC transporter ATP-binding protein [Gemmatimonadaceae bacterium]